MVLKPKARPFSWWQGSNFPKEPPEQNEPLDVELPPTAQQALLWHQGNGSFVEIKVRILKLQNLVFKSHIPLAEQHVPVLP